MSNVGSLAVPRASRPLLNRCLPPPTEAAILERNLPDRGDLPLTAAAAEPLGSSRPPWLSRIREPSAVQHRNIRGPVRDATAVAVDGLQGPEPELFRQRLRRQTDRAVMQQGLPAAAPAGAQKQQVGSEVVVLDSPPEVSSSVMLDQAAAAAAAVGPRLTHVRSNPQIGRWVARRSFAGGPAAAAAAAGPAAAGDSEQGLSQQQQQQLRARISSRVASMRSAMLASAARNVAGTAEGRGAAAAGRGEGEAAADDAELARKAQEEEDARFAAKLLEDERRQEQLQVSSIMAESCKFRLKAMGQRPACGGW